MAQIGALLVRKDGSDTTWPIYALGDSSGEPTIFECVKVYTPSGVGFCPVTDDSGAADMGFLKVVNDAGAVLYGNSTATFAPSFTVIEDFSSVPPWTNYSLQYSIGGLSRVTSPISISPDSIYSNTSTTATPYSFAGDGLSQYPGVGDTIECDFQFQTAGSGYFLIYFGAKGPGGQENYGAFYRNDMDHLSFRVDARGSGGSLTTISSTTSLTRYVNEWLTMKVEFLSGTKTISVIRKSDGSTVATTSGSNTTFDSEVGIGLGCKGPDLYLNTVRIS
jgi:hypothetical protein